MLTDVHPKLPMRNRVQTIDYYTGQLDFSILADHGDYLILKRDRVEIHFFLFKDLKPKTNYGMVYIRTDDVDSLYNAMVKNGVSIHPNDPLQVKAWGQKEFSLLDPDNNLLTFGQSMDE